MKKVILVLGFMALGSLLFAFDGERKGFIIGGGLGGSFYNFTQSIDSGSTSYTSDPEKGNGWATDFIIGYAPTNKLEIYYSNKVSWFKMENAASNTVVITSSLTGLGITYHFMKDSEWTPNIFVSSSVGLSSWATPFESNSTTWVGVGISGGVGFEFIKHLCLELNFKGMNPSYSSSDVRITSNFGAIDLTIKAVAF